MRADYHVHTEFSDDSNYPMEEVIEDAMELVDKVHDYVDIVEIGSQF